MRDVLVGKVRGIALVSCASNIRTRDRSGARRNGRNAWDGATDLEKSVARLEPARDVAGDVADFVANLPLPHVLGGKGMWGGGWRDKGTCCRRYCRNSCRYCRDFDCAIGSAAGESAIFPTLAGGEGRRIWLRLLPEVLPFLPESLPKFLPVLPEVLPVGESRSLQPGLQARYATMSSQCLVGEWSACWLPEPLPKFLPALPVMLPVGVTVKRFLSHDGGGG